MLITDGIKRMRFRDGYTLADEELMIPGEIYEVEVALPFTNYTWLPDHQIKIYVSGNSSTLEFKSAGWISHVYFCFTCYIYHYTASQ